MNDALKSWFISFCGLNEDDQECLDELVLKKLSIMMNGIVKVASLNCHLSPDRCSKLKPLSSNVFYPSGIEDTSAQITIDNLAYKEIAQVLLKHLPEVNILNEETFQVNYQ